MAVQVGCAEFCGPTVAFNVGAIALTGRTVAAGARRLDDHNLVRRKLHAARFWGKLQQSPITMLQLETPPEPRLGTKDTPRRLTEPLADAIELADVSNRTDASP